jgi:hypothetical protein
MGYGAPSRRHLGFGSHFSDFVEGVGGYLLGIQTNCMNNALEDGYLEWEYYGRFFPHLQSEAFYTVNPMHDALLTLVPFH